MSIYGSLKKKTIEGPVCGLWIARSDLVWRPLKLKETTIGICRGVGTPKLDADGSGTRRTRTASKFQLVSCVSLAPSLRTSFSTNIKWPIHFA